MRSKQPCQPASESGEAVGATIALGEEVLDLLIRPRRDIGVTMLVAIHDPQVAARCDRLIRLRDGAIVDDIDLVDHRDGEDTLRRVTGYG